MIESLIVLMLLLAAFFFFYDFAYGIATRLLLTHGAARVARAETVGFNRFHQTKALRVATIPVAGERLVPGRDSGRGVSSPAGELALMRTYLSSENEAEADGILDYERWESLRFTSDSDGTRSEVRAEMSLPLLLPAKFGRLFGIEPARSTDAAAGEQTLRARWGVEDHASFYLSR